MMIGTARHQPPANEAMIDRLSTASARRVIEPDTDVAGHVGTGQLLPDELLSVAGLPEIVLTAEQKKTLAREELAGIVTEGIRFEAVLMAGFGMSLSQSKQLTGPRVTYALHELGEETRHSRLFVRLLEQLDAKARSPFEYGIHGIVKRRILRSIIHHPALFCVLVLAGEEIPDLIQRRMCEHPDTDPFVRAVNRYHRQEEARHLAFARVLLPELWATSPWWQRVRVRYLAPVVIHQMFVMLAHPGVYKTVGLPGWRTWWAVQHSETMMAVRHESTRSVLAALQSAGAFRRSVPRGWRHLTGTDRAGHPITSVPRLGASIPEG
jgi:hypothetical protein